MKIKKIISAAFLICLTATSAFAGLKLNDSAPVFSLQAISGGNFNLDDVVGAKRKKNGHGVVLSFFASWCMPCRNELPLLNSFVDELRNRGIAVVLVDVKEDPQTVRELLAELKVDKPVVLSDIDGAIGEKYQVRFFPVTFFIDGGGSVKDVKYGGISGEKELRESIQKLFKE